MIMTNFAQRLKSVNFFQTTKFSNINIIFRNISLMFVQSFRSYFSEEIFLWSLSEWLSAQVCIFSKKKNKKLINSNQNQKRKQKKKNNAKQKRKYLHNIQG
jgi:tRNA(Glu) U13 pseudouridine synthase TruD